MANKILYLEKANNILTQDDSEKNPKVSRNFTHDANKLSFGGSDIHPDGKFSNVTHKEKVFNQFIN